VNPIKKYDGISIVDLSSDAPLADIVRQFKDYLFALNTVESGNNQHQRSRWPDTADPTNWLTGNASYKDLPGSDWITAALRYKGDYLVILKQYSLWLGYASLDTDIFKFDNKVPEIGCAAGRSAARVTLLMPTLEPSPAGFTISGRPSSSATAVPIGSAA